MPKILSVVERAYAGTLEEQDDTVLWVTHMIKNAGADISALLRGNATNYAVRGQDASGLTFGAEGISVPPTIDHDIEDMVNNGIVVYAVREDLEERGIVAEQLVAGVTPITRSDIARLFDEADMVWHW
jgi:predicted peroxiredoxin